ncbi:MAG: COR domain-containing protein [Cyanophyceae cyanobacterium]
MNEDKALEKIAQAKAEGWKKLDLSGMDLEELPAAIGELTSLTNLFLHGNQLSELPAEVGWLTDLTDLYLGYNQLKTLPTEIGHLTSFTSLDLGCNQLKALPAEIGQLTSLTSLDLRNSQLSEGEFPAEIMQLTSLTSLALAFNQLSKLPAEIGQLTSLTSLDLSANQLSELPTEILEPTSLTSLNLSANQLSKLPAEIGQLTSLTSLNLIANQLNELPAEIGQLTSLTSLSCGFLVIIQQHDFHLHVRYNKLSKLPAEIGRLVSLTNLDLGGNKLSELPAEIGRLVSLTNLDLGGNQLSELPTFLQEFSNLKELNLRGNPIPISPEILGVRSKSKRDRESVETILNFYFNTQREAEPFYEAKLILVGDGGAGKTTLANKLQNPDYDLKEAKRTEGIEVTPWEIQYPANHPYRINLWDFGGQDIYHATHQFFLTKRSLYVLVHDNREGKTDFYYWLRLIELLSDGSPVLLIKNRKEGVHGNIDEGSLRKEFKILKDSRETNLKTNDGLEDVDQLIKTYLCHHLPHIGDPIPAHWANIRAVLENISSNRNYIDLKEYKTLCRKNGFETERDMLDASQFLHDLGICLHFQEDRYLRQRLILKPTWATDTIYKIFDDDTVRNNYGRFTDETLETLWNEGDAAEMRGELFRLMEKFELCYEIPGERGHHIAPHLLPGESPEYDWDETDNLILSYFYPFKPKQIFPSFIVNLHRQIEGQRLVWKHGVVLTNGHTRAEIIEDDHYRNAALKIRVSGADKRGFLTVIAHELEKIQNSYGSGDNKLKYETRIPCNCIHCKGSQNPYTYTWESLERRYINGITEVQCDISYKFVNVQRLIADIATPPVVQVGERWPEPILDRSSPFNPGPVTIINTGGGDYRYTTVSKNAQYAERDITNNNAQSPEEIAKLLKTLLSDLELNANSDTGDLKEELLYQSPTTQNQLWDWMDRVMRDADTRDETIKTFAEVIGSQFGLAGAVAAGSFKIIYTALTKARRKRKELPADYSNPFDASGLW